MKNRIQEIPWSQPEIGDEELKQIIDTFESTWLSMGPRVNRFERAMAEYLQVPHAIAVSNGTVALDISLKILGIGPGDELIVPAMTYFATAASVSYQHAVPVFVDIEDDSFNIDPDSIEKALSPKTKGIIFIDYGGNPADIGRIQRIAKKHGLILLHDAAQSLGGVYNGAPLGAQTLISTMSFHMAKMMTTVEGGMIFTHDVKIAEEARIRRNQGESGKYIHSHLGTNARMMDILAAIGLAQIEKLPWLLRERERVAARYDSFFESHLGVERVRCRRRDSKNGYFFYPILVANRDAVAERLREKNIDTRIAYPMPLYKQELYSSGRALSRRTPCPITERFTSRVLNLPIYPSLTDEQVEIIAKEVIGAVER